MTLTVVTVVLLGGVNIFGGSGTIPGVVLAVLVGGGHAERPPPRQRDGRGPEHRPRAAPDPLGRHPQPLLTRPSRPSIESAEVGLRRPTRSSMVRQPVRRQRRNSLEAQINRAIDRPRDRRGPGVRGMLQLRTARRAGRRRRPRRRPPRPRPARDRRSATCRRTSSTSTSRRPRPASTRPPGEPAATVIQVGPNEPKAALQIPFIKDLTTQKVKRDHHLGRRQG